MRKAIQMTLIELLTFCLIIAIAITGSQFVGVRWGTVGYITGFVAGGAIIPLLLWWMHRLLPPPNDK